VMSCFTYVVSAILLIPLLTVAQQSSSSLSSSVVSSPSWSQPSVFEHSPRLSRRRHRHRDYRHDRDGDRFVQVRVADQVNDLSLSQEAMEVHAKGIFEKMDFASEIEMHKVKETEFQMLPLSIKNAYVLYALLDAGRSDQADDFFAFSQQMLIVVILELYYSILDTLFDFDSTLEENGLNKGGFFLLLAEPTKLPEYLVLDIETNKFLGGPNNRQGLTPAGQRNGLLQQITQVEKKLVSITETPNSAAFTKLAKAAQSAGGSAETLATDIINSCDAIIGFGADGVIDKIIELKRSSLAKGVLKGDFTPGSTAFASAIRQLSTVAFLLQEETKVPELIANWLIDMAGLAFNLAQRSDRLTKESLNKWSRRIKAFNSGSVIALAIAPGNPISIAVGITASLFTSALAAVTAVEKFWQQISTDTAEAIKVFALGLQFMLTDPDTGDYLTDPSQSQLAISRLALALEQALYPLDGFPFQETDKGRIEDVKTLISTSPSVDLGSVIESLASPVANVMKQVDKIKKVF